MIALIATGALINMRTEEERDFEKGFFKVACPKCGHKRLFALYEVGTFYGCGVCHEFAWLRYKYLDRERKIVYGLELVIEP